MIKLIAKDNFQPRGTTRPVRAGEVFDATDGLAAELITAGLAVPAPAEPSKVRETMIKGPKERRGRRTGE